MGFVGGGEGSFIAQAHRQAAGLDGRFELICGAFSRDAANNRRTGAALNLAEDRIYDDWRLMLEAEVKRPLEERLQMLIVVTPNHLHSPISQAALKAGFHVFCEKPAALDLTELLTLKATVQKAGRLYGLAHTYLGYPMVWEAQSLVQSGVLGKLRKVIVEYPQGWLSKDTAGQGNKQADWRSNPEQSGIGGCIGDIGTHAFSLAEFVTGLQVESLCAILGSHVEGRQLDDDACMLMKMQSGVTGALIASQVCAGEENALKIRVYGSEGGLEWRQEDPSSLIHRSLSQPLRILRSGVGQPWLSESARQRMRLPAGHPEGYLEAMANLYGDFARAIHANASGFNVPGVPGIEVGERGMAFIEAAIASHRSQSQWTEIRTL